MARALPDGRLKRAVVAAASQGGFTAGGRSPSRGAAAHPRRVVVGMGRKNVAGAEARGRFAAEPARAAFSDSASTSSAASGPGDKYFAKDKRPIILFDGVCNLCNGGVNFVLQWDSASKLRFAALQSEAGQNLLERSNRRRDDISSIVLVEESGSFIKSEAVLKIATYLSVPFPILAQFFFPLPLFVRDTVYDGVAANRYTFFGQTKECRIGDTSYSDRFVE
uniref:Thiol-disulfide oxidoreductase DCC n=1 Tax=Chloropicon laureae TaxID=464258 RepID=A0A7S3E3L4_9CHLO|mmetsp:Transcript_6070/g.15647  ORF Transcript_6070/g.15647 Transcript_6070/m.15647 type:complete len:222 (+) Transcript_6070:1-666(+)